MKLLLFQLALVVLTGGTGVFLWAKPEKCIRMQINFYRYINWIMEPVSMEKEIRNTRFMGVAVLACVLLLLAYIACSFLIRRFESA